MLHKSNMISWYTYELITVCVFFLFFFFFLWGGGGGGGSKKTEKLWTEFAGFFKKYILTMPQGTDNLILVVLLITIWIQEFF